MNNLFFFIIFYLVGCVSIERDIYFKDVNTKAEKTMSATRPGEQFRSEPFDVTGQGSTSTAESADERQVILSISNYADGSYSWGLILPVIAVFFLPQMHFSLAKSELLKVSCQIAPFFSSQFFERRKHIGNEEQYVLNKKGLELAERTSHQKDKCSALQVILPNGSKLSPIHLKPDDNSVRTNFEFDVAAADFKMLQVRVDEIQLESGRSVKVDVGFSAVIEDWTRYYMVPVAP